MAKRGPKTRTVRTDRPRARSSRDARWAVPDYFVDDEAIRAWGHIVGLLAEAGNLERTDPTLVEAYAVNVALMRQAHKDVADEGISSFRSQGGRIVNPAVSALNAASMRIKAIIAELGLSPASSKYAAEKGNPSGTTGEPSKWAGVFEVVG